jgi:hypothetical protein
MISAKIIYFLLANFLNYKTLTNYQPFLLRNFHIYCRLNKFLIYLVLKAPTFLTKIQVSEEGFKNCIQVN